MKNIYTVLLLFFSCCTIATGYNGFGALPETKPEGKIPVIPGVCLDTIIQERELTLCYLEDLNREDVRGVIKISEDIEGIQVSAYFDTDIAMIEPCKKEKLKKYKKNTIRINGCEFIVGQELNHISICLFIPEKIFYIAMGEIKFMVFEMYNFSPTTVGGGYSYIAIKLDQTHKIVAHRIFEYKKEPITADLLIKKVEKLFPSGDHRQQAEP